MARDTTGRYFYPHDFMQGNAYDGLFVGYEASARLSELAKLYPLMIQSKRDGKYIVRRIDFDKMYLWINTIPRSLKGIIDIEHTPAKAVSWADEA